MIEYDEFGRPKWPGGVQMGMEDAYLDRMMAPFEQPPADPNTPPVIGSAGGLSNYLGRKPTPDDPYGGINTTGPLADQAAERARAYQQPGVTGSEGNRQNMPQQYGVEEPYTGPEQPLTPQEAAERMPTNKDAMDKLIRQHMLPMAPKASRDGYENYVTASREKRAAEKAHLREQGALNRADAREKDQMAYDQTLRYNGLQGAGGGDSTSFGGMAGGPSVQRIGGYGFVRGHWRPQTPEEQAKTRLTNATAGFTEQRPLIEMMQEMSANSRSKAGIDAQAARSEADRKVRQAGVDESKRHHGVMETNASQQSKDKAAAALKEQNRKIVEEHMMKMQNAINELQFRHKASASRNQFGGPEYNAGLDTDYSKLDPQTKQPIPGVMHGETYKAIQADALRRLDLLRDMALEGAWDGDISPELERLIEELEIDAGRHPWEGDWRERRKREKSKLNSSATS